MILWTHNQTELVVGHMRFENFKYLGDDCTQPMEDKMKYKEE